MERNGGETKAIKKAFEELIPMRPTTQCSCCHTVDYVDELHLLPEVEAYARQVALFFMNKDVMPNPPDEDELQARYGYDSKSVFCYPCLQKLLGKVFV